MCLRSFGIWRVSRARLLLVTALFMSLGPGIQEALASARIKEQVSPAAASGLLPGKPLIAIGYVDGYVGYALISRLKHGPLRFALGQPLRVNGWAVDSLAHTLADGVWITVDGHHGMRAQYGQDRPDVARFFHNAAYRRSGFNEVLPTHGLTLGPHILRFQILAAHGRGYYAPEAGIPFVLTRSITLDSLPRLPGATMFAVGYVNSYVGPGLIAAEKHGPLPVAADQPLRVNGWALDSLAHTVAGGVFISVDGRHSVQAQYRQDRPDVAQFFRTPAYRRSGFTAVIPARWLSHGRHVLGFDIVAHSLEGYYGPLQNIGVLVR